MDVLCRLIAPFTPFLAEECWSKFKDGSVHLQSYPKPDEGLIDEEAEKKGEVIKEIVVAIRRFKHDKGMALNAPLKNVLLHSPYEIDVRDISGAINAKVEVLNKLPDVKLRIKKLKPKFSIVGPMFKDKAKKIVELVNNLSENDKMGFVEKGEIEISLDGESYKLKSEWFDAEIEKIVEGKAIENLEVGNVTLFIEV